MSYACGAKFKSYHTAERHCLYRGGCPRSPKNNMHCPWNHCSETLNSLNALKEHIYEDDDHRGDKGVECRRCCGLVGPSWYQVNCHEMNLGCHTEHQVAKSRIMRYNPSESPHPLVVFSFRSSSGEPPKSWGLGSITPIRPYADPHFMEYQRLFKDHRPSIGHSAYACLTKYTPAPKEGWQTGTNHKVVHYQHTAWKFTKCIESVLRSASTSSSTSSSTSASTPNLPTLVSIGNDGFSCTPKLLQNFLERNQEFHFVFCFTKKKKNSLDGQDGQEVQARVLYPLLIERNYFFWSPKLSSKELLRAIKDKATDNPLVAMLVELREFIEQGKDYCSVNHLTLWSKYRREGVRADGGGS